VHIFIVIHYQIELTKLITSLNSVTQKSSFTVIVHGLLLLHLCVNKTNKYLFTFKNQKNEKANSNRNTDSKWWWSKVQLITINSKTLFNSKNQKNEKANSNRNTDSKRWRTKVQLITINSNNITQLSKTKKMKKLTATETQTVNGGGLKFN